MCLSGFFLLWHSPSIFWLLFGVRKFILAPRKQNLGGLCEYDTHLSCTWVYAFFFFFFAYKQYASSLPLLQLVDQADEPNCWYSKTVSGNKAVPQSNSHESRVVSLRMMISDKQEIKGFVCINRNHRLVSGHLTSSSERRGPKKCH